MFLALVTTAALTTALLAGCGGGEGEAQPETGTVTVRGTSSMDGLFTETIVGPTPVASMDIAGEPAVGFSDGVNLTFCRAVFSFDLGSVPADARIKGAGLLVWQREFQGDFVGHHSGVAIDHVRVTAMPPAFAFASVQDYFAAVPPIRRRGTRPSALLPRWQTTGRRDGRIPASSCGGKCHRGPRRARRA